MKLTGKQTAFIDEYCVNGQNATQAALKAGYSVKTARLMGCLNITKQYIKEAISDKLTEIKAETVANRQQRQQFWTDMMANKAASNGDKLRASELLGRSEADFTDNIKRTDESGPVLDDAERQALADLARKYKVKLA